MDRDEAIQLLQLGKVWAWNQYRDRNPDWEPDLSGEIITTDLSYANLSSANICGTNFSKAKMFTGTSYLGSSNQNRINLSNAKFDVTTMFPPGLNPVDAGAVFVSQVEHRQEDRSRARVFISYAWGLFAIIEAKR